MTVNILRTLIIFAIGAGVGVVCYVVVAGLVALSHLVPFWVLPMCILIGIVFAFLYDIFGSPPEPPAA